MTLGSIQDLLENPGRVYRQGGATIFLGNRKRGEDLFSVKKGSKHFFSEENKTGGLFFHDEKGGP